MNQIARCDWLPKRARWSYFVPSGLPNVSCEKKFPEIQIVIPFWTKLFGTRWLDIGLVLFCEFMDLDSFSVHKHAIKGLGQYSDVLTSRMVNNLLVFVITVCLLNLRCVVK